MRFSEFLDSRRSMAKALVTALQKDFSYVSILGADIKARSVRADRNTTSISAGRDTECGFVVKMSNGGAFFEYSLDDISGDIAALAAKITAAFRLSSAMAGRTIRDIHLEDQPLVQSFSRPGDLDRYSDRELLEFCKAQRDALLAKVREIMPQIMDIYDKNGWEMGLFYLEKGHAEIRGMLDLIEEFPV